MIKARWIVFLVLLPIAEFSVWLALPLNEFLHTFCPQGFWRKPLLFGSNYCGYAPISILTAAIEFGGLIAVSLLCVLVIPQRSRFRAVRVLLLVWLCVPVAIGMWRGVSWSTLAEFTVSMLFWLGLSVFALVWPNHSLGADTLPQNSASRRWLRA
jgi:predicted membrane channel-forming protein YqfA (hemolysin III family)